MAAKWIAAIILFNAFVFAGAQQSTIDSLEKCFFASMDSLRKYEKRGYDSTNRIIGSDTVRANFKKILQDVMEARGKLLNINSGSCLCALYAKSAECIIVDNAKRPLSRVAVRCERKRGGYSVNRDTTGSRGDFLYFSDDYSFLLTNRPDTFYIIANYRNYCDTAQFLAKRYNCCHFEVSPYIDTIYVKRKKR
jgi:hypothetical protein